MMPDTKFYTSSKYEKDLWFPAKPPGRARYFEHAFEGHAIEGRILYNSTKEDPWVFSIHGARADFTKSDAVSFGLQQRNYSILSMNMSGHSKASSKLPEETTLGDNVTEVETFYDYLGNKKKKIVIAYSLGGTPALNLLRKDANDIDKLVLFYPGIYTKEAYNKHFGKEFKDTVSKPFSYYDNDTIELLRTFQGNLLLVKGQYDGLDPKEFGKYAGGSAGEITIDGQTYYSPIPKDVIDMVYNAIPSSRRQLIEIPDCGHSVVLWMRTHKKESEVFLNKLDQFLKKA